jgi:isoleucyl-tRNA synthetase
MDKWILSELNLLIQEVDTAYSDFDSQAAGKELARFIDDLSNWYVRRSRRRFWDGDASALATLHECLTVLTQLLAPMIPFITEQVWQELVRPTNAKASHSVHLSDFPIADKSMINLDLRREVSLTKRIVELGRAARAESGVKIRQPLSRALIAASGWASLPVAMREQIADELNVISLEDIADADGDLVDISIKANFRTLGTKFGGAVQEIAKAIGAQDATELVRTLRSKGTSTISAGSSSWEISLEDLAITEVPKSGWMVASHDGESVALDLELTPSLIAAGNVREVIRFIQERRKSDGFDISDRIDIAWNASDVVAQAVLADLEHIKSEVLAIDMNQDMALEISDNELGMNVILKKNS